MPGKILLSTAYLPPVEYISILSKADEVFIEMEENYLKQSYRNRCYVLSAHGPQLLTVPVYLGSVHKTLVRDIRIDYSKRWQQVHLGALIASYNSSPYFQFYFSEIEKIIASRNDFLIDLNMKLMKEILRMLRLKTEISLTTSFEPAVNSGNDFRYSISPKHKSEFTLKRYPMVFDSGDENLQRLSILDLIFNTGPEAGHYL